MTEGRQTQGQTDAVVRQNAVDRSETLLAATPGGQPD